MNPETSKGAIEVGPLWVVQSVETEVEFLTAVFGARISGIKRSEQGQVVQAEARIGSVSMAITRSQAASPPVHAAMHVWAADVDAVYRRALAANGAKIQAPADQPSGIRQAVVLDPEGITWQISQEETRGSNQDVERLLADQRKNRL
jgi:uncharacterized glyoxalase superfamily protein PhnB